MKEFRQEEILWWGGVFKKKKGNTFYGEACEEANVAPNRNKRCALKWLNVPPYIQGA